MHSLERFALAKNDLTSHIPPSLFNNTQSIKQISLMNNSLSGPVPHNLGSLPKLEFLYLGYNNLSGIVPPTIYNMSRMQWLYLAHNNFAGSIPTNQSFSLPLLKILVLEQNNFVGPIPPGLAACKNFEILTLAQLFCGRRSNMVGSTTTSHRSFLGSK